MENQTDSRCSFVKKFLDLYLDRCNFWHAFAFFQHRSHMAGVDLAQLKEIFEDRQRCMLGLLQKVGQLMMTKDIYFSPAAELELEAGTQKKKKRRKREKSVQEWQNHKNGPSTETK